MKIGRASQRSDGLESWTCFPEVQRLNFGRASQRSMDLNLGRASQRSDGLKFGRSSQRSKDLNFGRASQRSDGLKFGRASQRSDGLESWPCFPEVRWIGILAMLSRGPMD